MSHRRTQTLSADPAAAARHERAGYPDEIQEKKDFIGQAQITEVTEWYVDR